jgi:hypothetical protein
MPVTSWQHVNSLTMFNCYRGKVASFPEAVLFLLFGSSVFILRFAQVLFSLGSLICIYYVLSRNFNRIVGIFTVFLLGIDSTFIRATRIGHIQHEVLQIFLFWLGLALIQLYIDKKKRAFLCASGFIFGVALWAKIMFLGYFLGVVGAFLIFGKKSFMLLRMRIFKKKQDITVFIVTFIIGCLPLIIFNIFNQWATIGTILNSFNCSFRVTEHKIWNNFDFLQNFKIRMRDFYDLLNSQIVSYPSYATGNNLGHTLFFLSLSVILFYLFFIKKETLSKRKISFLLIAYGILLCLTSFIPRGCSYDPAHLIILLPIMQIVEALFIGLIIIYLRKKAWAYLIILSLFIPHTYNEFSIMRKVWDGLRDEKDVVCSGIMNELTSYLVNNNIQEVFCLGNIFLQTIDFISSLKVITWGFNNYERSSFGDYDYGGPEGEATIESVYEYRLNKINPFYLVRIKEDDLLKNAFQRLRKLIERDKKQLLLIKTFCNKPKTICYELYRVK